MSPSMKSFVGRYSRLKDISRALEGQGKWEDSLLSPAGLAKSFQQWSQRSLTKGS